MEVGKNLVLLSGGLDSAVNLLLAEKRGGVALALTVDYGQKAAAREKEKAAAICRRYGIRHEVVETRWLADFSRDALTSRKRKVPEVRPADLERETGHNESSWAVWVPNRNGLLLNVGACVAESLGIPYVIMGLNAEEGEYFPDNSAAFVREANRFLGYSTRRRVRLRSFTAKWDKREILRVAMEMRLPMEEIWSCYNGGAFMCGNCESCSRFLAAAEALGVSDRIAGLFVLQE